MSALPLKWKAFRIANYLHMSGIMLAMLAILYLFFAFESSSFADQLLLVLFLLVFGILMGNCIINLYLLDKCYPDKIYSQRLQVFSIVVIVMTAVILSGMALVFLYGLYQTISRWNGPDMEGIIALVLFGTIISTGVYVSWLQVTLKKTIRRNYEQGMDNFLITDQV